MPTLCFDLINDEDEETYRKMVEDCGEDEPAESEEWEEADDLEQLF